MEQLFLNESVKYLNSYMERLQLACKELSQEQIWWRPHERALSIGTSLLHLNGNITQWILSNLGTWHDSRNRAAEFDYSNHKSKEVLFAELESTVKEATKVIQHLHSHKLLEVKQIQGFNSNGLQTIYHVVEHMSWHVAQVTYVSKLLQGSTYHFSFYDNEVLNKVTKNE
jgi:uncharacterized damage-inducible protein DinB